MDTLLTRKQFFRQCAHQAARLAIDFVDPAQGGTSASAADENALAADLTPELLEQEARRLGLDPADPRQVLEQLSRQLHKPRD